MLKRFSSLLTLAIILFPPQIYVEAQTGCPAGSDIVYSPFVSVSQSSYRNWTGGTDNGCWWWATCVLAQADEPRKLQFASVALVMGLIPLTLKDLAWPERRIVAVSRDLPAVADTLVRALGIVPAVVGPAAAKHAFFSSRMYHWAYSHPLPWQRAMVTAGSIFLLLLYATMVVLEVYSKRSALGCVYPASIFSWQLVALIPAALTTLFRHRTAEGKLDPASEVQLSVALDPEQEAVMFPSARVNSLASLVGKVGGTPLRRSLSTPALTSFHQPSRISSMAYPSHRSRGFAARVEAREFEPRHSSVVQTRFQNDQNDDISAVHGRGMLWIVPFSWGVYYVAGTLVYSSIMAVTVIELFVWVVVSFSVAVTSKILTLLICTLFEKR